MKKRIFAADNEESNFMLETSNLLYMHIPNGNIGSQGSDIMELHFTNSMVGSLNFKDDASIETITELMEAIGRFQATAPSVSELDIRKILKAIEPENDVQLNYTPTE
jgi:hypothetical protein